MYIQLGHIAFSLPLGNGAYRLGLLSAVAAALALALLFTLCRRRWGAPAGLCAALLLGLNATFWSVAQVQEMYSLWMLGAAGLMGLAWAVGKRYDRRLWLALALAFGLCLTNRLDILLWAPGLLWIALGSDDRGEASLWAGAALVAFPALMVGLGSNFPIAALILGTALWRAPAAEHRWRWAAASLLFAGLGLAVYLFLPVRSACLPFLDWNHPATLANFKESLLRTRYGGTLDLLSKNYAAGELFGANMKLYALHLWDAFSLGGLLAALAGCAACARREPRRWLGMAAAYWWSGPVFLFMANLPPNPHAAAIVEPHRLLSDLVLVFWAAEGVGLLQARSASAAWAAAALAASVPLLSGILPRMDRRAHLFSYDYAKNVLRSAPRGAAVVAKKDVQLYALWHYQTVQGWRPDVRLISQGLAGTPWYQEGLRRAAPGLFIGPLRDEGQWRRLAALDAPAYATPDAELPGSLIKDSAPRGLLNALPGAPRAPAGFLWELMSRRGVYDYDRQPDFFTSDLIEAYAQARFRQAAADFQAGALESARARLLGAWSQHWGFSEPAVFLGYMAYARGDLKTAWKSYGQAVDIGRSLVGLAEEYHSLPEVKSALRGPGRGLEPARGHLRKIGRPAAAEADYRRSLAVSRRPKRITTWRCWLGAGTGRCPIANWRKRSFSSRAMSKPLIPWPSCARGPDSS